MGEKKLYFEFRRTEEFKNAKNASGYMQNMKYEMWRLFTKSDLNRG